MFGGGSALKSLFLERSLSVMKWVPATTLQHASQFSIPDRWLAIHYYEALNILFRTENALRLLVYVVLKNEHREKWVNLSMLGDEGDSSISSVAKKRRSQAQTCGYLGYPVTSPLLYLTTGEL